VLWLRLFVADLSTRRAWLNTEHLHMGFVVDKLSLGQDFYPGNSLFPYQFHFTGVPLQ
jgi:hypothetical protein